MATSDIPSTCPSCGDDVLWLGVDDIIELPVQGSGTDRYDTGDFTKLEVEVLEVSAPTCPVCGYIRLTDRRITQSD